MPTMSLYSHGLLASPHQMLKLTPSFPPATFNAHQHQPVSLLNLFHQLISGEGSFHREDQVLDNVISTVHVQKTSHHHRETRRVHFLYIDLNVLLQVVAIQVEHQVVHKVESVTDNDQG